MDGDFEDAFKDDETDERPRRSLNNAAMVAIPGAILKIVARRTDASKVQRFSMIIYLETADHMLKFRILFRFGFRSIILGICRFSA